MPKLRVKDLIGTVDGGKPVLSAAKMEEHRVLTDVVKLYLQGYAQADIADATVQSVATVRKYLDLQLEVWRAERSRGFEDRAAEELAKINHLETMAWEAYFRSCGQSVRKTVKTEKAPRKKKPSTKQAEIESLRDDIEKEIASHQGQHPPRGKGRPTTNPLQEQERLYEGTVAEGKEKLHTIRKTTETQTEQRAGDPRFLDRVAWCIETRMRVLGMYKQDPRANKTEIHVNWGDLLKSPQQMMASRPQVVGEIERQILEVEALPAALPAPKYATVNLEPELDPVSQAIAELDELCPELKSRRRSLR